MASITCSRTGIPEPDEPAWDDLDETVDDVIDLTDRRRILLHALFGVAVPPSAADAVFR